MGYKWTVLVGKERMSGAMMAITVPEKGGTGMFALDRTIDFANRVLSLPMHPYLLKRKLI